jgi:uncharacterized protein with FMN-binding domain
MARTKTPRRLVALSASAIATVYFAGLLTTRGAAVDLTQAASAAVASPSVTTVSMNTSSSSSGYADGTYTGTATSRYGSLSVATTIAGGRITDVSIVNASTTFPVSQIASLPNAVVQSQSARVNAVSGATASSQAFKQAVASALAQAASASTTAGVSA